MSQTRKRSILEATSMTLGGICYAVPLNYWMINYIQWGSQWSQAFWLTVWFTAIGFVYKYYVRRFFNWLDETHPSDPYENDNIIG